MQFGRGCCLWGQDCSSPSGSGCCPPASLALAGDGPVNSQLALFWCSLSPLFCEWTQQCLKLELFAGKFFLSFFLFLSFFSFFSLAIPQFGLLSHVSSLRLSSGHSGPLLTLNNANHTSLFSPCLLVADACVWATYLLGVVFRYMICGFYLFFPPGYVVL